MKHRHGVISTGLKQQAVDGLFYWDISDHEAIETGSGNYSFKSVSFGFCLQL